MGDYPSLPLHQKVGIRSDESLKYVSPSKPVVTEEVIQATSGRVAAEIRGIARELKRTRTAADRRDVLAALLWQADSIRRILVAEQDLMLSQMGKD